MADDATHTSHAHISGGQPAHDHPCQDDRKTAHVAGAVEPCPAYTYGHDGVLHLHSHSLARQILRANHTRQSGFMIEDLGRLRDARIVPVLYQDGPEHQKQRASVARFFAPKTVNTRYRALMVRQAETLVARLAEHKHMRLDTLSMEMAVAVAAEIVGLTNSPLTDMAQRLDRFFSVSLEGGVVKRSINMLRNRWYLFQFYRADVRPAIRARKKQTEADVISHLLEQHYRSDQILTECITYGAAGMVTTREFITIACWHLMEQSALRHRFLAAEEAEQIEIIEEILRLEPVVGTLYRRTMADICLKDEDTPLHIQAGTRVAIDIRSANTDTQLTGACPYTLNPDRQANSQRDIGAAMSFGDGMHRCPGASVALQESAIFLDRLLRLPGIRLIEPPKIGWNKLVAGYELRGAVLSIE